MSKGKGRIFGLSVAVLAAGVLTLGPLQTARAEGFIESIFSSLGHVLHAPARLPEHVPAYAEPLPTIERTVSPPAARVEAGPSKAFCVRTCDGHYFPVRAHAGMSAAEACYAFCPASKTRLYSGSTIDYARARDGSRYAGLDTAYAYRRRLVAGCTCNGRDPFGLAHIDAAADPTLRPGDVVATRNGMVAFAGRKNGTAEFTPAASYLHFSKSYRETLAAMQIMPPNLSAPPALPVTLPLSSAAQGYQHSASR